MNSSVSATLPPEVAADLFSVERFPCLSPQGASLLVRMRAHPHAPQYRNFSGPRLTRWQLLQARGRHAWLQQARLPPPGHADAPAPRWVQHWAASVWPQLPWRARQSRRAPAWHEIATTQRADLSTDLVAHMRWGPHRLRDLICFVTSGSTGHPLRIPSLPRVAADYQAFHRRAMSHFGIRPQARRGQVGIVLVGYQRRCFTYVSINPLQDDCGLAKINLMPTDWCDPGDRVAYLDDLAPELISGDPVSLSALHSLGMTHRPRALLSTSMHLMPALRLQWEHDFQCPVLDLYSMNEVGPLAVFDARLDGFLPLQPRLYIELLDEAGHPVPLGCRGEITVSGGFNPCLPLLRYRTGDHARWAPSPQGWVLRDLEGRSPVRFRNAQGHWINNVYLTQALRPVPLTRFALHQHADDRLHLRVDVPDLQSWEPALREILHAQLGALPVTVSALDREDKVRQYTRDDSPVV